MGRRNLEAVFGRILQHKPRATFAILFPAKRTTTRDWIDHLTNNTGSPTQRPSFIHFLSFAFLSSFFILCWSVWMSVLLSFLLLLFLFFNFSVLFFLPLFLSFSVSFCLSVILPFFSYVCLFNSYKFESSRAVLLRFFYLNSWIKSLFSAYFVTMRQPGAITPTHWPSTCHTSPFSVSYLLLLCHHHYSSPGWGSVAMIPLLHLCLSSASCPFTPSSSSLSLKPSLNLFTWRPLLLFPLPGSSHVCFTTSSLCLISSEQKTTPLPHDTFT